MLDGWYCRSIANEAAAAEEEERAQEESKHKAQYKFLKGKLKHLLYENECFQHALRTAQKKLLTVSRDRNFLLDRLLLYEKTEETSTESDDSDSSEDEPVKVEPVRKRRFESAVSHSNGSYVNSGRNVPPVKRKRPNPPTRQPKASASSSHHSSTMQLQIPTSANSTSSSSTLLDGHMTPEEVERHLQSRQSYLELERAPPTVPTEMFSNEPSLDSESNDLGDLETSPSNIGEELSIDMIQE
ncbi:INO80 complex subunit E isoform X2 [Onthophagus taurus]|uniref:INO80 complex subunit E isoform X2 n=1 Tax=Onthophagus taurus TaxID=166361 RepID=UPI000C20719E|nr:INO80 complex subunit E isoform X2 [Onthophagus taurus]